jgi:hypothetical protein
MRSLTDHSLPRSGVLIGMGPRGGQSLFAIRDEFTSAGSANTAARLVTAQRLGHFDR